MTQSNLIRSPRLGRAVIASALIFGAVLAAPSALACTLGNWSSTGGSGTVIANNPFGTDGDPPGNTTNVARYSGACGARMTGEAWVQDNNPGGISRIVARFYVLNNLSSGSTTIYEGYSATDGSGALFTVEMNDAGQVTLTDVATSQNVSQTSSTNWASVEIDFGQAASEGFISLSVNGQTPNEVTVSNAGSAIQSVRMGNLDGTPGALNFDAYESRRSTAVGRLLVGDANASDDITTGDVVTVRNEILETSLSQGSPDCNEDGNITTGDVVCIRNIILASP